VPVTGSDELIAKARPPTYYLRFHREDHTSLLGGKDAALMDETVTAFLDYYLDDNPDPLADLPDQVEASGLATFDSRAGQR
jgi:hypothetical protein